MGSNRMRQGQAADQVAMPGCVPATPFVASILLTTVSTVALGPVPTYPFIVLLRFLQGLGAGALLPLLLGRCYGASRFMQASRRSHRRSRSRSPAGSPSICRGK